MSDKPRTGLDTRVAAAITCFVACLGSILLLIFWQPPLNEHKNFDLDTFQTAENKGKFYLFTDPAGAEVKQPPVGNNKPSTLGYSGLKQGPLRIDDFRVESREGRDYVSLLLDLEGYEQAEVEVKKEELLVGAYPDTPLKLKPKSILQDKLKRQPWTLAIIPLSLGAGVFFLWLFSKDVSDFKERDRLLANAGNDPYIGRFVSDYLIREFRAKGNQARVYLGTDPKGRKVAIKIFSNEMPKKEQYMAGETFKQDAYDADLKIFRTDRERFRLECALVANLNHPNIGKVFARGEEDDFLWYVMPYYDEGSLEETIEQGKLEPKKVLQYAAEMAAGLALVHDENVIHRDLKPANIMLNKGQLVIIDFGLGKNREEDLSLTQTHQGLGTPLYMPPQQCYGAKMLGPEADLYAYGTILYELMTGSHPFPEDKPLGELLQLKLMNQITPIRDFVPDISPELEAVFDKMISSTPSDLYASVREAHSAFEKAYKDWNDSRS